MTIHGPSRHVSCEMARAVIDIEGSNLSSRYRRRPTPALSRLEYATSLQIRITRGLISFRI